MKQEYTIHITYLSICAFVTRGTRHGLVNEKMERGKRKIKLDRLVKHKSTLRALTEYQSLL